MKTFLEHVARHLIKAYGSNLNHLTIVLPGQRAALYMNHLLLEAADGPIWAPQYTTIDQLFIQLSSLKKEAPIHLVCRLYDIYQDLVAEPMSLDDFYGWGEILLSDFDDIDKHLVDAHKLFRNVSELKEMDTNDFLDDDQLKALRDFFSNFNEEEQTKVKQRFMDLWNAMPRIYEQLNERLRKEGMGYTGAIYRGVAEQLQHDGLPTSIHGRNFAFVGFNVLDDVEQMLFDALQEAGCATFYWDYDDFYFKNKEQEAGLFMRQNVKRYPNALPADIYDNLLGSEKKVRFIATNTDNAQARYVPTWLEEKLTDKENESAVILCDETLVNAILNSVPNPDEASYAPSAVNITMGFPLTETPIYSYLLSLLELQTYGWDETLGHFRPSFLARVQTNPFATTDMELKYLPSDNDMLNWLIDETELLSQRVNDGSLEDGKLRQLYTESAFQCYLALNQFSQLIEAGGLPVRRHTLYRLIRRALHSVSVPFHGEMDSGLQIMGLLEARNLDFRHILMLSVGEGFLPRKVDDTSMIPYCLKPSFNLSTIERKTAVFAYYFYRTIQRAEDITIMYNDNSNGATQREQSRFLRQLLAETSLEIECLRLEPSLKPQEMQQITVDKTPEIMDLLASQFDENCQAVHRLSPSALASYLSCPLKFYFQHVAQLNIPYRREEGIDNLIIGTLFHDTAEFVYTHLKHCSGTDRITAEDLLPLLPDRQETEGEKAKAKMLLSAYIDLAFWVDYFLGDQYDSYKQPEARRAFLQPYLEASARETLLAMVNALYQERNAQAGDASFAGLPMIVRDVLTRLIEYLLDWDYMHTPFTMYGMEQTVSSVMQISCPSGERNVRIGGRVDRMDIMEIEGQPTLRVVDYKTGKPKTIPKDIQGFFARAAVGSEYYYLQTFLYAMLLMQKQELPVSPCLFYPREARNAEQYSPSLKLDREVLHEIPHEMITEFTEGLRLLITEIFSPEIPFTQTQKPEDFCPGCDFRTLCGR